MAASVHLPPCVAMDWPFGYVGVSKRCFFLGVGSHVRIMVYWAYRREDRTFGKSYDFQIYGRR